MHASAEHIAAGTGRKYSTLPFGNTVGGHGVLFGILVTQMVAYCPFCHFSSMHLSKLFIVLVPTFAQFTVLYKELKRKNSQQVFEPRISNQNVHFQRATDTP